jgi:hypothetical protein
MDDSVVRVKRRRRRIVKPPLWQRRPGLVILVMVGVALTALLIVAAVSGLVETVGEWAQVGQEDGPMYLYDPDAEACMELHERFILGEIADFTCDMKCSDCHAQGTFGSPD